MEGCRLILKYLPRTLIYPDRLFQCHSTPMSHLCQFVISDRMSLKGGAEPRLCCLTVLGALICVNKRTNTPRLYGLLDLSAQKHSVLWLGQDIVIESR